MMKENLNNLRDKSFCCQIHEIVVLGSKMKHSINISNTKANESNCVKLMNGY